MGAWHKGDKVRVGDVDKAKFFRQIAQVAKNARMGFVVKVVPKDNAPGR